MSSITGILSGIVMVIAGGGDGIIDAKDVLNTGKVIYQINEKKKNDTIDASIHEESHQIVKDVITEIGRK
jgi:hypothetical protein